MPASCSPRARSACSSRWRCWSSPSCCGGASAPTWPSRWSGWGRRRSPACWPTAPGCSSTGARRGRWAIPVVVRPRRPGRRRAAVFRSSARYRAQAGQGAGAQRVPGGDATAAGRRSPIRARRPTSTPSCSAGPTTWRCSRSTSSRGSTGASRSTARPASAISSTCSATALALYAVNYVPNAPQPGRAGAWPTSIDKADRPAGVGVLADAQPASATSTPTPTRSSATTSCCRPTWPSRSTLYEAATGSTRFDEPGSLTFVWKDGRTFAYDHHAIVEAVRRNFEANELGLLPVRAGVGVHGLQHDGRPGAEGPRHAARHATTGPTWSPAGAAAVEERDAHARRQPAPHPLEDHRAVVRHRRGARAASTSSPARTASSTWRPTSPRGAGCWRCAASTPGWPRSPTLIVDGVLELDLEPDARAQHLHRHGGARVDAPDRGQRSAAVTGPRHGRASPRQSEHARPVNGGRSDLCTPASRPWASTWSCGGGHPVDPATWPSAAIGPGRARPGERPGPGLLVTEARAPDPDTLEVTVEPGLSPGNHRLELEHLRPEVTYVVDSSSGRSTFRADPRWTSGRRRGRGRAHPRPHRATPRHEDHQHRPELDPAGAVGMPALPPPSARPEPGRTGRRRAPGASHRDPPLTGRDQTTG